MEVLYPVCCALDVHQASVTACLRSPGDGPQRRQEVRTFGTTTRELLGLADWLTAAGCTHVAMESTGIYWRPVYNILEGSCELSVVNAQHVKMVPGRKTDVRDSEWLAQLLELGLLRRSFVPPAAQRELCDLVRYRKRLIEERAQEANRVQKVLEPANIKLASVVTTVLGVSARAMLKALIAGEQAPEQLADLAQRRLRRKRAALGEALTGRVTAHHRFLLDHLLRHIEFLGGAIAACDRQVETLTGPHAEALAQLDTIPGVAPPHGRVDEAEHIPERIVRLPELRVVRPEPAVHDETRETGADFDAEELHAVNGCQGHQAALGASPSDQTAAPSSTTSFRRNCPGMNACPTLSRRTAPSKSRHYRRMPASSLRLRCRRRRSGFRRDGRPRRVSVKPRAPRRGASPHANPSGRRLRRRRRPRCARRIPSPRPA